jgi:hypothetical protein
MGHYFAEMNPNGRDDRHDHVSNLGFSIKAFRASNERFKKHKQKIEAQRRKLLEQKICELLSCNEKDLKIAYEILKEKFKN